MRSAVLVTGASRSFGQHLALDFTRQIETPHLDIFLWARHEQDLKETERLVKDEWKGKLTNDVDGLDFMQKKAAGELRTFVQVVDLGNKDDYIPKIDAVIAQLQAEKYKCVYLVHNAGSLGELGYTQEWSTHDMLAKYWDFNVISVCWFNKRFVEAFGADREELTRAITAASQTDSTSQPKVDPQAVIVNITSLCGIKPFQTHGLYCAGKAAREMHHQVIAAEQAPSPKLRVLSYSPGPMDTGMQQTIRESPAVFEQFSTMYSEMKAKGTLVPPEKSSRRGVLLTLSGEFETGSHVDYYDLDHLG